MLMRFHFGLGVGHVYSHRRNAQVMHQRDDSAVQCRVEESDDEDDQFRDENESMQDDEDDDDVQMMDPADQWYGSSQESLVEQFEAIARNSAPLTSTLGIQWRPTLLQRLLWAFDGTDVSRLIERLDLKWYVPGIF
ncbi:hypothetical protein EDD22DRAFT_960371 [Suillus occidentalis]|nr:hypothetical protein EDD22DRAFT_960371 [Suillus occidentalis]